ncbi:MAG: MCE family protein [Acidimicrobiales bacterium]
MAALAVVVVMFATVVVAVRASYGAFKGGYTVVGTFDRAAYGFGPSTEIDYLGIDVGHVTHVHLLADHRVVASLKIRSGFAVPVGSKAQVHNRSLFGDPYVELVFPAGPASRFLVKGDHIEATSVDADTPELIRTATSLLGGINGQDLATLVTTLDQATQGEGAKIAQSIHDGAQLAALFAQTIRAQLQALDAFSAFQSAITPTASDLNTLAAQGNRALPTLNAAEAEFQTALDTVNRFAGKLSDVIAAERPNIDALLLGGDNVVRLLAMREPQIEQVISGASQYFQKFALGAGPETLPNGTKFVYFKNFIAVNDVVKLICGLIIPSGGVPAPLQPIVSGLSGAGLGCPAASGAVEPHAAARDLMNQVAAQIGAPEKAQSMTLEDLLAAMMGRG